MGAKRLFVVAATVAAILACGIAPAQQAPAAQPLRAPQSPPPADNPLQHQLKSEVSGPRTLPHLRRLQRIADHNGGNRASPGPGYDASVDYVVGVLRDAGWQVSTPTFDLDGRAVRNVIAQTRTGDFGHVVMAGAHLDSVPDGPGINDNGSGSAVLLEIATRLGGSPTLNNQVRLAWWGAEEVGLGGSTNYVEGLSRADRQRIALYLNLDMVASPNAGYLVEGGVGRGEDAGPRGSAVVARVLAEQLTATGVTSDIIEFEGDSDYAAFIDTGIPTGGALTGDDEEKTRRQAARWGGKANAVFDPCYHEACDTLKNINSKALDRYADAVAGTIAHFAISISDLPSQ